MSGAWAFRREVGGLCDEAGKTAQAIAFAPRDSGGSGSGLPFFGRRPDGIFETIDGLERCGMADFNDLPGQGLCIGDFAVLFKEFVQSLFSIGIHQVKGRQGLPLIHPHIHCCILAD